MNAKLFLLLSFLSFFSIQELLAQDKVPFREINDPHFYMGQQEINLKPDYNKFVITFQDAVQVQSNLEFYTDMFGMDESIEYIQEYNAAIFEFSKSDKKRKVKKVINQAQKSNLVSCIYPFYELEGGALYYFDVLNFKLKQDMDNKQLTNLLNSHGVNWMRDYESEFPGGVSFAQVDKGVSIFEVSRSLHQTGLFTYIYPMSSREVSEDYTPNDVEYSNQWHLEQASDADIDASSAWDLTKGDSNLVVAILELNGFDSDHPDLVDNVVEEYNGYLDTYSAQYLDNTHTHGTSVLGCAGASTDNNLGVSGVGFYIKVMPVILTAATSNFVTAATLQRVADHILANNNVVGINNSWSGNSFDAAENDQFQRMRIYSRSGLGSVVVASSGNNGDQLCRYPACYPNILAIGRTTAFDARSSSSVYHDSLDVSAPGSNIWTTDIEGFLGDAGDYTTASGTSFSSPIVAAVIGLMASINPNLEEAQLADFLEQTCEKVGGYSYITTTGRPNGTWHEQLGYGRINAFDAVTLAGTIPVACSVPLGMHENYVQDDLVQLDWDPVMGVLYYETELRKQGTTTWLPFSTTNALSQVVADDLDCNSLYEWRIRTVCSSGSVSAWSDSEFFTTSVCPCNTPDNLTSSNITTTSVVFSWDIVPAATSYDLEYRVLGGAWIAQNPSSSSYSANNLLCGRSYQWRVRSVCNNGISGYSSLQSVSTSGATSPDLVVPAMNANVYGNDIGFNWQDQGPGVMYHLQVSKDPNFGAPLFYDNAMISTNVQTVSGFQNDNSNFYWRVRADGCGQWTAYSSSFTFRNVDTPTSISDIDLKFLKIYPNPNSGVFLIDLRGVSEAIAQIRILNVLGEEVFQQRLSSNELINIQLNSLASGSYFVALTSEDGVVFMEKVVIA